MDKVNKDFSISARDLPNDFLERVTFQLQNYSTVLIRLRLDSHGNPQPVQQIGTGTYVSVGNYHGILTAYHVTDALRPGDALGIFVQPQGIEQRVIIPSKEISILEIAKPVKEEEGPDLSFIILSQDWIKTIEMAKSFYPLETNREKILFSPLPWEGGVWFVCSMPEERTVIEDSEVFGPGSIYTFTGYCGATGPEREFSLGHFDYLDSIVEYCDDIAQNVPRSFAGTSGGGLWQIPIIKEGDEITAKDYIFSGVVFYQSARKNNRRFIRSHGRRSIYEVTYETILKRLEKNKTPKISDCLF